MLALHCPTADTAVPQMGVMFLGVTSNEVLNRTKYRHMQRGGRFFNPFTRGVLSNLQEAWREMRGNPQVDCLRLWKPADEQV
jgi:hypothetical protein